ncbi:hypothetical protein [Nocardiopsis synnemataformans]|uniref:hypothetical protein n=1 Tax=Nocardiopsis synnemataformans TaxID=61305 RepID=UPI003EB946D7
MTDRTARPHPRGILAGALLAVVFGYLAWTGWPTGDWRSLAAIPAALLAVAGASVMAEAAQTVPRDHRGRRVP